MNQSALIDLCYYLESTPFSIYLQNNFWAVPTMQTLHILAIASVLVASLLIDFRIIGLHGKSESIATVIARYRSLVWLALPVLLVTGCIMIISEPARSLTNPIFQLKMMMLLLVILITLHLQKTYPKNALHEEANAFNRILAICSLLLWSGIVAAGRWIAYT